MPFVLEMILCIYTYVVSSTVALIVTIVHAGSAGVDVYFDGLW